MKSAISTILFLALTVVSVPAVAYSSSVLKLAVDNKWNAVMEEVRNGADVNQTDDQGRTLLMFCARLNYPRILDELIRAGSNVNQKDNSQQMAIHYAVKNGRYEQVIKLVKAGAGLQGSTGAELLAFALSWDDANTALALIALGAVPAKDDYKKLGLLMVEAAERPLTAAALNLLNYKIDFNYQDKNLKTALMYAAQHGHINLVSGLIGAGVKIDEKDRRGRTALSYAVKASVAKPVLIKDPLQELFSETYKTDYKAVIKALRQAGAKANEEMMSYLIDQESNQGFWKYYIRSQLYYWEIILYYIGIILAMVLMFGQFDKLVDGAAILVSIIVGFITTLGLLSNHMPELQFILTTTGIGAVIFASLRALVVTALALSLIYLIWQLLETTTDKHQCIIVDDDLCCPECGKPLTLDYKKKGFCPYCKKRFTELQETGE